jgi:hypothetical protein
LGGKPIAIRDALEPVLMTAGGAQSASHRTSASDRQECRPRRQWLAIAYLYSRDNEAEARRAKMLTADGTRRIAISIAPLPELLAAAGKRERLTGAQWRTRPMTKAERFM